MNNTKLSILSETELRNMHQILPAEPRKGQKSDGIVSTWKKPSIVKKVEFCYFIDTNLKLVERANERIQGRINT